VLRLLSQDRALFQDDVWASLPDVLPDLLERQRLNSCVIDDLDSGKPAFFGVTAWTTPAAVATLLQREPGGFRSALLRAETEYGSKSLLLSRKQLAAANSSDNLALVHLAGCPDETDFTKPRGFEVHRLAFSFFMTNHGGYQIAEVWQENVVPEGSLYATTMGMTEVRNVPVGREEPARLFRFTRQDAQRMPGSQLAYLMKYPPPRLGFTGAQQRLLELALLDYSDIAAAEELGVTHEAIRKRWRSIHARHNFREGKDQRRGLLAYIRQHMEELRPWTDTRA
jgi:hypothetical protein